MKKSKKRLISYITSIGTYPTMNSWNGSYGYSYNMKIYNLPVTQEQKNKLYELLDVEDIFDSVNLLIDTWQEMMFKKYGGYIKNEEYRFNIKEKTEEQIKEQIKKLENYSYKYDRHGTEILTMTKDVNKSYFEAGFNGRSGGYLVLYKYNGYNYTGTGWTHTAEELEEMNYSEVLEIYKILKDFEKLYLDIIEEAKYLADNAKIEEETYTVEKTRKVISL